MQPVEQQYDVGVIIGRFQVHALHDAHRELIQFVCDRHDKVIILLGLSPLKVSSNNPLDFEARKQMILADFPDVNVLYIPDRVTNLAWSRHLDTQITDLVSPGQSAVLYGGRDSFIEHYRGKFPTQELMQSTWMSGKEQRKLIARSRAKASPEFRAGVIWASQGRFPTAYTTVDIAIVDENARRLLLGRKTDESKWRFIGGFSDPRSDSFEADAIREVREETGLEVGDLRYIGSTKIDDWRYRNEPDCIKTMMFVGKYLHGHPAPDDDIAEVKWFDLPGPGGVADNGAWDQFYSQIMPAHRPLMEMLRFNLNRKES